MAPPRGVGSSPRGGATGLSLGNPVFVSIHHFFMSSCVYILFSAARNRFYIGMTTLPINERIKRHNEAYYSGKFTTGADDWQLMIELPCKSVDMARELEQWIKRKACKTGRDDQRSTITSIDSPASSPSSQSCTA